MSTFKTRVDRDVLVAIIPPLSLIHSPLKTILRQESSMKYIDGIKDDAAHSDGSFAMQFAKKFSHSWDNCTVDTESVESFLCFQENEVSSEKIDNTH
jgi:hypothetical protein